MRKIDVLAIILVVAIGWILMKEFQTPGTIKASREGQDNHNQKVQQSSDSVLSSLDDQLDKFADELAADMAGVTPNPDIKGFENGIPEAYAPKSTASFDTKEKLMADLEYRLKRFKHDANEAQEEFKKSHDIQGKDNKTYSELVNKQLAQEKQMKARHLELVQGFEAESNPDLKGFK